MKRGIIAICLAGVAALAIWIARNTTWEDTPIDVEPSGEARSNPFYAEAKFAEALGATTAWDREFAVPPSGAVLVVSSLHWSVNATRQSSLERWVEGGGRLVVVGGLTGGLREFARWSTIDRRETAPAGSGDDPPRQPDPPCDAFTEEISGVPPRARIDRPPVRICELDTSATLVTTGTPAWALRNRSGLQVMRVGVGQGRVTVINASPFGRRRILDQDHGWLFAAATELRRGDAVHFLSEGEYPSLLSLVWLNGGPMVALGLLAIGLALWRGGTRFGPRMAPPPAARRSLTEQIRGSGWFALHHGGGDALHAASVRALEEAARRRVHGYERLTAAERTAALAQLTGYDRLALSAAIHHPGLRRSQELLGTIALLEGARRLVERGGRRRTVETRPVENSADGST